jgi:hypothetical protein
MVYCPDLVKGIVAAAESPNTIGEIYFLSENNYKIKDLVSKIAHGIGKKRGFPIRVPIFFFRLFSWFNLPMFHFFRNTPIPSPDKVRELKQLYWVCSTEKAERDFGWSAPTSMETGAAKTWEYYQQKAAYEKNKEYECKSTRWAMYFTFAVLIGILIEFMAVYGEVYKFKPGWVVIPVIFGLWGGIFGSLALVMRKCSIILQYIPGFLILFGGELLNNFYFHLWTFPNGSLYGITNPFVRAAVLGAATGFIIPIINFVMTRFFRLKLRIG